MKPGAAIVLLISLLTVTACSFGNRESPTGLKPGMTKAQASEIMGQPSRVKPVGANREILIYKQHPERINVFFVDGRIKSIEHVQQQPVIGR